MSTLERKNTSLGVLGSPAFVLFCIFLVLKLIGQIDWSWVWVFAPLWISIGFVALIIALALVGSILSEKFENWRFRRRRNDGFNERFLARARKQYPGSRVTQCDEDSMAPVPIHPE